MHWEIMSWSCDRRTWNALGDVTIDHGSALGVSCDYRPMGVHWEIM